MLDKVKFIDYLGQETLESMTHVIIPLDSILHFNFSKIQILEV